MTKAPDPLDPALPVGDARDAEQRRIAEAREALTKLATGGAGEVARRLAQRISGWWPSSTPRTSSRPSTARHDHNLTRSPPCSPGCVPVPASGARPPNWLDKPAGPSAAGRAARPAPTARRPWILVWLYGSDGMLSSMKTTVNLPDELLREAQELARRERTTLKDLIETGLRTVVAQRSATSAFALTDASVDGNGLQQEFRGARWDQIRDAIYRQPA